MRLKKFENLSWKKIFERQGIDCPARINKDFVLRLLEDGRLSLSRNNYGEAVEAVENLSEGSIVLFPDRFKVCAKDSEKRIKSLDDLVKIDSVRVLREISKGAKIPSRLTQKFAEKYEIKPRDLIREATSFCHVERPPVGFYWVGQDGTSSIVTWMRATEGIEMEIMKQKGDFSAEILDSVPYGRSLRVKVDSREGKGKYDVNLFRLPMYLEGENRKFLDWINMKHSSTDPDHHYRGNAHERRKNPAFIWSASSIFAFYEAMIFAKGYSEKKQFRVNPFPIPKNKESIDFIDDLRLRSLMLSYDKKSGRVGLRPLKKAEMDRFIGARTILRGYDNCWAHGGEKDWSFLYRPDD